MAKSEFSQTIREKYKEREREIKIKGEIKYYDTTTESEVNVITIGGNETSYQSNNLLPAFTDEINVERAGGDTQNIKYNDGVINITSTLYGGGAENYFSNFDTFTLQPGTYTLSLIEKSPGETPNKDIQIYLLNGTEQHNVDTTIAVVDNMGIYSSNLVYTFTLSETTIINYIRIDTWQNRVYDNEYYLMLNSGNTAMPFEKAGMITIPQILDFNVDEKSDIYYESMPMAELDIDVDNTDGYFSDFDVNSIVDQLNKNCYIDFYLNIDETGWCRAWTMQFDSLTADNQRAHLVFKPYCTSIINMDQIYDKDKQYLKSSGVWSMTDFADYMFNNYDINLSQDESTGSVIVLNYPNAKAVKDLLLKYGAGVANFENGQMLSILDNKRMRYKLNTRIGTTQEDITDNELLEKPLITKEELEGIVLTSRTIKSYSSTSTNWQKTISSVLKNTTDILVVYGEEYNMVGVSANDITMTGATLVSVSYIPYGGVAGNGSHYLVIEITGNVGDRYTIEINSSLAREEEVETKQEIYAKGSYETTDNFLKINSFEYANSQYWFKLLDHLTKKVEMQIKALPYLQVGDSITLDDVGNVVIAEIHTSWSDGFKMKIIAYKVEYALYN